MKKTIAVIFGGQSTEHDISIITALSAVIRPLKADGEYDVLPVYITKQGEWYADEKLADVSFYQTGNVSKKLESLKQVWLEIGSGMTLIKPGLRPVRMHIDVVFPAMHGTNGEDGALMGLLQMAGVPYVGCDLQSSVVAMDKVLCKQVAAAANVPVVKAVSFTKQNYADASDEYIRRIHELELPLFVKPAHLGSSIGITRVTSFDDLENAIEVALHYDNIVLVEEGVRNLIEVTVPIMGNDNPRIALVERPLSKEADFFDFETKYIGEGGKKGGGKSGLGYSELPAELPDDLYEKTVNIALEVYKAIGACGVARVDLLIDSKLKRVYFNEINPMPGDLYSHNWQKAGISPVKLVESLIDLAVQRFDSQQKLESSFTTNFLKQF